MQLNVVVLRETIPVESGYPFVLSTVDKFDCDSEVLNQTCEHYSRTSSDDSTIDQEIHFRVLVENDIQVAFGSPSEDGNSLNWR